MTKITYPSAEFLRSILRYDPETGEFWWRHRADRKNPWNARYAGKPAGRFTKSGYREITISRRLLQANRIAWIMVHGDIATDLDIDHEDGDPSNNRIKNLRPATRSQNMWNCALPAHNTSGFKGVSLNKATGLHAAHIHESGQIRYLGSFQSAEMASEAYKQAALARSPEFFRL